MGLQVFFILQNWNFIPIKQQPPHFPLPQATDNHHSTFCVYEFDFFGILIEVESSQMGLFVIGLFHLA